MLPGKSKTIDLASPVNWQWEGNRGLVAWYLALPGFMGGAKWRDLCGPADLNVGNHGTLKFATSALWRPANRLGGYGSLKLAATTDYVALPSFATLTNNFTVSAWGLLGTVSTFAALWSDDDTQRFLGVTGSGFPYCQSNTGGKSVTGSIAISGWTNLVMTKSSVSGLALYSNGVLIGSAPTATPPSTVGASSALGYATISAAFPWPGFLDDLRIYNRPLGATEIPSLYLESSQGYPRGLRRIRCFAQKNVLTGSPAKILSYL